MALLLGVLSWRLAPGATSLGLRLAAGVLFGVATVWPGMLAWPFRVAEWLMKPIRRAASLIALGTIYYGIVTPLALIMRWTGRDALALKRDPSAASYWRPRPPAPEPRSYYRQF